MSILSYTFLGNTVLQWSAAAGAAIIVAVALALVSRFVRSRISAWTARTPGKVDDVVTGMLNATRSWFILSIAVLAASQTLVLSERTSQLLGSVLAVAVIVQVGLWLNTGIASWLDQYLRARRDVDATGATTAAILGFVARVILWTLVLLMVLDNFGVDVTALVASLGIGGIAVALAAQNILGDIFASLAIALDKPFVIGDFIVLDKELGTVEHVGLKTTHLRSLSGEQIVMPNNDLLSSRIRNYKRMAQRRVILSFGVTYETESEQLRRIPDVVRRIVESQKAARFDRAHMAKFGESALEFEAVYFVNDPDYNRYMDIQQEINFRLFDELRGAGVQFAYPTRTLHFTPKNGG